MVKQQKKGRKTRSTEGREKQRKKERGFKYTNFSWEGGRGGETANKVKEEGKN